MRKPADAPEMARSGSACIIAASEPWTVPTSDRPDKCDPLDMAKKAFRAWVETGNAGTRNVYAHALGWLSHFLKVPSSWDAVYMVGTLGSEKGSELIYGFSLFLLYQRKATKNTIKTYRAAVNQSLQILNECNLIDWTPKRIPYPIRTEHEEENNFNELKRYFSGSKWTDKRNLSIVSLICRDSFSHKKIREMNLGYDLSNLKSKDLIEDYIASRPYSDGLRSLFVCENKVGNFFDILNYSRISKRNICAVVSRKLGLKLKPHSLKMVGAA